MTPAAQVQAAIELLSLIEAGGKPADRQLTDYFRERRFAGSKDRRRIGDLVYRVLRQQARLDWWRARAAADCECGVGAARSRVIAALALADGAAAVPPLFDGSGYGPAALSAAETAWLDALDDGALIHADQPDWVRGEVPQWLFPALRESLGDGVLEELEALGRPAPLDLRVNGLKAERAAALAALAAEGIDCAPTPVSPLGLRVAGRHQLPALHAFQEGLVEVQDEGSQIVALLCDARPGMAVADLCAGAGGKTLALGATMNGRGRLVALDVDGKRLARARPRAQRAGLEDVAFKPLEGDDDPWLAANGGAFDRVLVDAPCSGSGAWRRHPEARWRLRPTDLNRYRAAQREALSKAAGLVKPGGRLIYATCSLLRAENQAAVADFAARHPGFAPLPLAELWRDVGLSGACPAGADGLLLTPARHRTDGFFVAVLERRARPSDG